MAFPYELYQLPSKLHIRYQDKEGREEFAHFLGRWLSQVPHLLDLNPLVLLEGVGLLYPEDGEYASTWAWAQCWSWDKRRPHHGMGLLWWLNRWQESPSNAVLMGLTMWCHLGRFPVSFRARRHGPEDALVFPEDVWERFLRAPTPIPGLVKLLHLCVDLKLWTHEQVRSFKSNPSEFLSEPRILTNPCGEIFLGDPTDPYDPDSPLWP